MYRGRRLQVGVEAALLAGVVGHADGADLGEPEPRDGVEEPRIDVAAGCVHDLGVGRGLHVRPRGRDAAVADDDGPHERLAGQGVHGPALDRVGLGGGGGGGAKGDSGGEADRGAEGGGRAEGSGGAQAVRVAQAARVALAADVVREPVSPRRRIAPGEPLAPREPGAGRGPSVPIVRTSVVRLIGLPPSSA